MQSSKPYIAEIKARGQITIPKKIREEKHLEEGQEVTLIPLGEAILLAPRRLELDEARRRISRILKTSGVSADDLLAELVRERESLYQEKYGKKAR